MNKTFTFLVMILCFCFSTSVMAQYNECGYAGPSSPAVAPDAPINPAYTQTTAVVCADGSFSECSTPTAAGASFAADCGSPNYDFIITDPTDVATGDGGAAVLGVDGTGAIVPSALGFAVGDQVCMTGFCYDLNQIQVLIDEINNNSSACSAAESLAGVAVCPIPVPNSLGDLFALAGALGGGGSVSIGDVVALLPQLDQLSALGITNVPVCGLLSGASNTPDYCMEVVDCAAGSPCVAPIVGCMDMCAPNFDPTATEAGACDAYDMTCNTDCAAGPFGGAWDAATCGCIGETTPVSGCTDAGATNFNASANCNDGSCMFATTGCTDPCSANYNPAATVDDGSCSAQLNGCTDPAADNYDPTALCDDGSCMTTGGACAITNVTVTQNCTGNGDDYQLCVSFDAANTGASGTFDIYLNDAIIAGPFNYSDAAAAAGCFTITGYTGDASDLETGLNICVSDSDAAAPGAGGGGSSGCDAGEIYIASSEGTGDGGCTTAGEYVEICHAACECSDAAIDISGWEIEDEATVDGSPETSINIVSGSLLPGECVTIYSGYTTGDIAGPASGDMGSSITIASDRMTCPLWNSGGDTAFLYDGDSQGGATLIDSESTAGGFTMNEAPTPTCTTGGGTECNGCATLDETACGTTGGGCGACVGAGGLFISELSFNPSTAQGNDSDCEYIEIFNGFSNSVSLDEVVISNGLDFAFPAGSTIASGEYIIIAANPTGIMGCAFPNGVAAGTQIFGPFDNGNLGNGGGEVLLVTLACAEDGTDLQTQVTYGAVIGDGDGNSVNYGIATATEYSAPPTPGSGDCTGCSGANYDCSPVVVDVPGCTDPCSANFDPAATVDDGSCSAQLNGCTNASADNYDPNALCDDGSCILSCNPVITTFPANCPPGGDGN